MSFYIYCYYKIASKITMHNLINAFNIINADKTITSTLYSLVKLLLIFA